MTDSLPDKQLREEFNRWAEAGRGDGAGSPAHHAAGAGEDAARPYGQRAGRGLWSGLAFAAAGEVSARGARYWDGHFRRDDPSRAARQRGLRQFDVRRGRSCANSLAAALFLARDFRGVFVLLVGPCRRHQRYFSRAPGWRLSVDSDQLLPRQSALPPVGKLAGGENAPTPR